MVLTEDRPQGRVLWANEEARQFRVLPGQRYAASLALATELRAGVVPEVEIQKGVDETAECLRRFSPAVEPSRDEPGVFWIDAGGLGHLHPDLRTWAQAIQDELAKLGLRSCVTVGFTRFGVYAISRALASRMIRAASGAVTTSAEASAPRAGPGLDRRNSLQPSSGTVAASAASPSPRSGPAALLSEDASRRDPCVEPPPPTDGVQCPPPVPPPTLAVLPDEAAERRTLSRVPLDRLGIEPEVRDLLAKLGVRTVDQFLDLPSRGLQDRFGDVVHRLHRLASGDIRDPLAPETAPEHLRAGVTLEHAESDGTRLLFLAKRLLDPLLFRAAERREAVTGLELRLRLDRGGDRIDVLRPAAPTLDAVQLLDLVRLRLEATRLPCGATDVELTANTLPATEAQLALFAEKPKRDLAAADRAIARLRAEFGESSVVRAQLREAHLPEVAFDWIPLEHAKLPRARPPARPGAAADASSRPLFGPTAGPTPGPTPGLTAGPTTGPTAGRTTAPTLAPITAPIIPRAPLVRRILAKPLPLSPRPRHEPGHELGGWMLRGFEQGNVVRMEGPYVISGGWWGGDEIRREYHFAETARGRLFWVFYDTRRRRWFLQGEVS